MRKPINMATGKLSVPQSKIDLIKADVCNLIIEFAARAQWDQRYLADYLGVSQATVSRINRHRFHCLSLEVLLRHLERVRPHYRFLIAP